MLRSLQHLRETAPAAALIAGDEERLVLTGGGGGYRMPWHWHDGLMILLPAVGAVDFRDETRPSGTWLGEDRFVVVPKMRAHQTAAAGAGHRHVAIYATDAQLARIEPRLGSLTRVRTKLDMPMVFAATPDMRSMLALCQAGEAGDRALPAVRGHLAAALFIRCLAQIEQTDALSMAGAGSHGDLLVSEIRSFIRQNASEDLSLDGIAGTFGLSRRHATRLFREKTGLSIAGFQEQERIAQARRLLIETALPVGEIAWRVGFETGSALARAMRRVTGLTPTSVRRAMARSDTC